MNIANPPKNTPQPVNRPPVLALSALLRGGRQVVLEHAGERYCLSVTRAGKLILTK